MRTLDYFSGGAPMPLFGGETPVPVELLHQANVERVVK